MDKIYNKMASNSTGIANIENKYYIMLIRP